MRRDRGGQIERRVCSRFLPVVVLSLPLIFGSFLFSCFLFLSLISCFLVSNRTRHTHLLSSPLIPSHLIASPCISSEPVTVDYPGPLAQDLDCNPASPYPHEELDIATNRIAGLVLGDLGRAVCVLHPRVISGVSDAAHALGALRPAERREAKCRRGFFCCDPDGAKGLCRRE